VTDAKQVSTKDSAGWVGAGSTVGSPPPSTVVAGRASSAGSELLAGLFAVSPGALTTVEPTVVSTAVVSTAAALRSSAGDAAPGEHEAATRPAMTSTSGVNRVRRIAA
jgi:hypothetical protein